MTTTQLQLRRDTTANIDAITPAQGEPIYDATRKALVLGDGATAGGLCATPFSGTWTPSLLFGGTNTGMTGTFAGTWVQMGPIVIAFFAVSLTAKGSATGAATINGLPVAAIAGQEGAVMHGTWANLNSSFTPLGWVEASSMTIALTKPGASAANMADTDFTNTTTLNGMAIYQAAQPTG